MHKGQSGYCESCGSDDLDYNDRADVACSVGYRFTCNACGKSGVEWYDITYSETVMDKED